MKFGPSSQVWICLLSFSHDMTLMTWTQKFSWPAGSYLAQTAIIFPAIFACYAPARPSKRTHSSTALINSGRAAIRYNICVQ